MNNIYKQSNKFNPFSFFLGSILVTGINLAITAVAAILGLWLGRPYVGIILVALSAVLAMILFKYMLLFTKTRNRSISHIVIFISTLLTAYYHMCVVVSAINTLGSVVSETDPSRLIKDFIPIVYSNIFLKDPSSLTPALFLRPNYVFGSFITSGLSWIVYLLIIILSLLIIPQLGVSITRQPFDKSTNRWMEKVYSVGRLQHFLPEERNTLQKELQQGNIDSLLQRTRCTRYNADTYAKLFFYKIGNEHSGYVGTENFKHLYSKDNELSIDRFTTEEFIPAMKLGADNAARLEKELNSSAIISFGIEDAIPNTSFHRLQENQNKNNK